MQLIRSNNFDDMEINSMRPIRVIMALIILAIITMPKCVRAQLPQFDDTAVVKIYGYFGIESKGKSQLLPQLGESEFYIGEMKTGLGSGAMIDPRGIILTANHVIDGARFIVVRIRGNTLSYPAIILYQDEDNDFSLLYIIGYFRHYISLPEQPVVVKTGMRVWAYGYPVLPGEQNPTITSGHITNRSTVTGLWQIDAAVNPGNSGGPIVDSIGNLIGIVVSQISGSQLMNYAMPIENVMPTLRSLFGTGQLETLMSEFRRRSSSQQKLSQNFARNLSRYMEKDDYYMISFASDFADFIDKHINDLEKNRELANCVAISAIAIWNDCVFDLLNAGRLKMTDLTEEDYNCLLKASNLMSKAVDLDVRLLETEVIKQIMDFNETISKIEELASKTPPDIEIFSPYENELWKRGEQHIVAWHTTITNDYINKQLDFLLIKLEYSTNNGRNWELIHDFTFLSSQESEWIRDENRFGYPLIVPQNIKSNQCMFRVSIKNKNNEMKTAQSRTFRIK